MNNVNNGNLKGKKCYNNGITHIYLNDGDPIPEGFVKGRSASTKQKLASTQWQSGQQAWNKGLRASEKTKAKASASHKGRWKITNGLEEKDIPANSSTPEGWYRGRSDCAKQKISQKNLNVSRNKGKRLSEEQRNKISNSKKGHSVSKETRDKISKIHKGIKLSPEKLQIKLTKEYITKQKNNSFNTSSTEVKFYEYLLEENKNKTIYKQYKDDKRYPFYCDFYIVEDDLFIELNAHWTHGGKPYDPNDEACQEQLKQWQEKAKTSKFYQNAIITWTVRDVEKQKCAKENNLNYKVIY